MFFNKVVSVCSRKMRIVVMIDLQEVGEAPAHFEVEDVGLQEASDQARESLREEAAVTRGEELMIAAKVCAVYI